MIPATVPCYARFKNTLVDNAGKESVFYENFRVLAWSDDGDPLIVGHKSRHLVPADTFRNFVGLAESAPDEKFVALIPAGGWRIEWTYEGKTDSEPLVGWGLREDGTVEPLTTDCDGLVDTSRGGGDARIYHPDATPPATAEEKPDGAPSA